MSQGGGLCPRATSASQAPGCRRAAAPPATAVRGIPGGRQGSGQTSQEPTPHPPTTHAGLGLQENHVWLPAGPHTGHRAEHRQAACFPRGGTVLRRRVCDTPRAQNRHRKQVLWAPDHLGTEPVRQQKLTRNQLLLQTRLPTCLNLSIELLSLGHHTAHYRPEAPSFK